MNVYFNIETLPANGMSGMDFMNEVKVGNAVDPATVANKRMKGGAELYLKTSTRPFLAHVFCASLLTDEGEPEVIINYDELELIASVDSWVRLVKCEVPPDDRIVWHTFNGLRFDHPITRLRALKYGCIGLEKEMRHRKWGDEHHVDWFLRLGAPDDGKGPIKGKLDEVARFFGISYENPINGSQIYAAWHGQNLDAIRLHTRSRVLILRDLNRRLQQFQLDPIRDEAPEVSDE